MWIAVIPACNEADSIARVMDSVIRANINTLVVVANGCTDDTCLTTLRSSAGINLYILHFIEPLGVDIPRAAGAAFALLLDPEGIVFVDGDMKGKLRHVISGLVSGIKNGLDMALTNCYPFTVNRSKLALSVLRARERLNRQLGLLDELGLATPSHGPHAVSKRFLQTIPVKALAIPPLSLAMAVSYGLSVGVGASISHDLLGSENRRGEHADLVAKTIIADSKSALEFLNSGGLKYTIESYNHHRGYGPMRRFDILDRFLKQVLDSEQKDLP